MEAEMSETLVQERRASQEALQSMLSSLFDASCVCDSDGQLTSCTPQLRELLGSDDPLLGCKLADFAASKSEEERLCAFLQRAGENAVREAAKTRVCLQPMSCESRQPIEFIVYAVKLPEIRQLWQDEKMESADCCAVEGLSVGLQSLGLPAVRWKGETGIQTKITSKFCRRTKPRTRAVFNTRSQALRQFRETPDHTVEQMVYDAMGRMNPRGKGCCFYHVALRVLHRTIVELSAQSCHPSFAPNQAWQCEKCYAMHADDEDLPFCMVCDYPNRCDDQMHALQDNNSTYTDDNMADDEHELD
jgi:hypothetical protein